ncbi:ATP-binding protein [Aliihoeflea sp. PC F10.4]
MTAAGHSFIDVAVLNGVRERFARGDAIVLLPPELDKVIWANGPGAALFGHADIDSAAGSDAGLSVQARRQVASLSGYPRIGTERTISLRLNQGAISRMVTLEAAQLRLPRGELAIMLCQPASRASGLSANAAAVISGFSQAGYAAGLVGAQGTLVAATDDFDELGLGQSALRGLIDNVARKRDRLVKTLVEVDGGQLPVGFARLSDEPPLHLLLTVQPASDDGEEDVVETPEPLESVSEAPPTTIPDEVAEPGQSEGEADPAALLEKAPPPIDDLPVQPVRFVWRTDANGRFKEVSPEFIRAVGANAADIIGRSFGDVATVFGFDLDGEISALLERRDTWSGRTVFWPVEGHALKVPVDLAALPVYDRDRTFEGFRGFGVVRPADAVEDADALGLALVRPQQADAAPADEPPVAEADTATQTEATEDAGDNVVRLDDKRTLPAKTLSPGDRETFREIGTRLKGQIGPDDDDAATDDRQAQERARFADSDPDDASVIEEEADEANGATIVHLADARPDETESEPAPASQEAGVDENAPMPPATVHFLPSAFATTSTEETHVEDELIGHLPVATLIHSGEELHFANSAFFDLTGFASLKAFAEAGGLDALFETERPAMDGILALKRADGTEVPVKAHLHAVPWHGGKALMLTLVAQEKAETTLPAEDDQNDVLRAHLAQFQTIIDTATDGVVLIDNDFAVRSISQPAEALFGFDSAAVEGRAFRELFAIESQRSAQDYVERIAGSGVDAVMNDGREVIGREAEGGFIPLFMTIGRLPMDGGYCAVLRDITHWKRVEEDLTHARAEAERASSQKSEFLARISHEIRTPLNAIIGFSELIINESFGPIGTERYRDYLRDISRSGNHVLDLVNDLLDISKIEAGEQELNYEAVSLNDVLGEAVAMMQPQANRERVIIRSSFASRLPDVVADLRSIRQIALNLLSNAVRYTPAGGQVILSTALEPDGGIAVRVRDTGIGMTAPEIDQALKPFKRVNALKRSHREGTGLGLPLTKALVEANRARFAISSKPDEGTLVEIDFPATRVLAD